MTDPSEPRAFVVPPVCKSITVGCELTRTFTAFTQEIGAWWPHRSHSVFAGKSAGNAIEPRPAGHFYETSTDGQRALIGIVAVWEPPSRLTFTWHPGRDIETAQIVDVKFHARESGTAINLTHSGWENLGADAQARRDQYDNGWDLVFARCFASYVSDPSSST